MSALGGDGPCVQTAQGRLRLARGSRAARMTAQGRSASRASAVLERRAQAAASSAGEWRAAAGGGTLAVEDPRPARRSSRSPTRSAEDALAALAAAADAQAEWAAHPPRERGEILRRAYRGDRRADRRARAADDARDGQVARRVARRDRLCGRVLPLVLRGGRADPRPLHGQHDRQGPHPDDAPAGRAVRVRHALELPDGDGHAQDRAGDRRRLHDGRQARPADAAVDARARARSSRRPGLPGGRAQRDHRARTRAR